MNALNVFVDALAGAAPSVVPAAILIGILVELAKARGWLSPADDPEAFWTAPRLSALLNGVAFLAVITGRALGVEAKVTDVFGLLAQLIPILTLLVPALGISALTHAVLKKTGHAVALN